MKSLLILLLLAGFLQVQAQYRVTFQFKHFPAYHAANSLVFIVGNFNNWKPDSSGFSNTTDHLSIQLPKGTYEYKFTRGSWQRSETNLSGESISNRSITIESDTTLAVDILGWSDHFSQQQ